MKPRLTTVCLGVAALAAVTLLLRRLVDDEQPSVARKSPNRVPYEVGL